MKFASSLAIAALVLLATLSSASMATASELDTIKAFLAKLDEAESSEAGHTKIPDFFSKTPVIYSDWLDPESLKMAKRCVSLKEHLQRAPSLIKEFATFKTNREIIESAVAEDGSTAVVRVRRHEDGQTKQGVKVTRDFPEELYLAKLNGEWIIVVLVLLTNTQN